MFGGRKKGWVGEFVEQVSVPKPTSTRYVVECFTVMGTSPGTSSALVKKGYAKDLQSFLNAGEDKGWKLVQLAGLGQAETTIVVWDTLNQRKEEDM